MTSGPKDWPPLLRGMITFMRRTAAGLLVLIVIAGQAAAADLRIGSWNVRHLGWTGETKSYEALAEVISYFDLVGLQEVMSEQGAETLRRAVEKRTGERWGVSSSHLVGRGSYREMYSFLWRQSAVRYVDGAVVYIDSRDVFAREPYAARFEAADGSIRFVMASVHVIYGDDESRRRAEAQALKDYWEWLAGAFPEDSLFILGGDFNLPPTDKAWSSLKGIAEPLITKGASTLSPHDGRYASLYDNLWVPKGVPLPITAAGILRFPQDVLGWPHKKALERVSDHAPVYLRLNTAAKSVVFGERAAVATPSTAAPATAAVPAKNVSSASGSVIANKASGIYHWQGCPGYAGTSAANRVLFGSRGEAEAKGYRPAKNC